MQQTLSLVSSQWAHLLIIVTFLKVSHELGIDQIIETCFIADYNPIVISWLLIIVRRLFSGQIRVDVSVFIIHKLLLVQDMHEGMDEPLDLLFGYFQEFSSSDSRDKSSQQYIQRLCFFVMIESLKENYCSTKDNNPCNENDSILGEVEGILLESFDELGEYFWIVTTWVLTGKAGVT